MNRALNTISTSCISTSPCSYVSTLSLCSADRAHTLLLFSTSIEQCYNGMSANFLFSSVPRAPKSSVQCSRQGMSVLHLLRQRTVS